MKIENKKVTDLKPYPNNPRDHGPLIEPLTSLIRRYGFRVPILIKKDGTVIDGHARLTVANRLGIGIVPAVIVDDLTDDEIKALRLAMNSSASLANWEEFSLTKELEDLKTTFPNDLASVTAFPSDLLDSLLNDLDDPIDEKVELQTLRNDVQFPTVGPFELPRLLDEPYYKGPAPACWLPGRTNGEGPWLYNYNSDSYFGLDWETAVIGFYTSDSKLAKLWRDTAGVVAQFKEKRVLACITPDFSIFPSQALPLRLMSTYQSLWCGRYFQEIGIPIIINVASGKREIDKFLEAIPSGKVLARQIQGSLDKQATLDEWAILEAIVSYQPSSLWVYAPDKNVRRFDSLLSKINTHCITPRFWEKKKHGKFIEPSSI